MDIEQARSEANKARRNLVLASVALGVVLGFGLGIVVADLTTERVTVIVPDCSGVKV